MSHLANKTGNVEQWTADIITNETFTHTVTAWTDNGIQRARVRRMDGEIIAERTSEKAKPLPQRDLEDWAATAASEDHK